MPHFVRCALLFVASIPVACAGTAADTPTNGAEPELRSLPGGDFAMLEEPARQLSSIGCRHYTKLHLSGNTAALEPALDSADPSDMDPDGSCGGEEIPPNSTSRYPLTLSERTSCGASIYTGTIKWTDSGKVTRTLRLTDYRAARCTSSPARIVAEITSTYEGQTNPITTYYSVDPAS